MSNSDNLSLKRRILFTIILLFIPVIFLEFLLQGYYRIENGNYLFNRIALPIYSEDEHRVYSLKPELDFRHTTNEFDVVYHTNGQGFRTDEQRRDVNIQKDEDVYRVLFLGPSFALGWGNDYEDAYTTMISQNMVVDQKRIEVINLGTPAQPISYQLCWFKEIGHLFEPDMIVQTIYGNPLTIRPECKISAKPPVIVDGYLIKPDSSTATKLFAYAKSSGIVFYGWYLYQQATSTGTDNQGLGTELYEESASTFSLKSINKGVNYYSQYLTFVESHAKQEVPVIFLHIPFSYVVRAEDLSRWEHRGWASPFKLRDAANQVEERLRQQDIIFINPLDELVKNDKVDQRMYYFLDLHLTPLGNKVVADTAIPIINGNIYLREK